MQLRTITAEHLQLALVAHKALPQTRWAAMSNGAHTQSCRAKAGQWRVKHGPLLVPMDRGYINRAVESVRMSDGLDGVRRTFGCGIKALRAELSTNIMRRAAATRLEG